MSKDDRRFQFDWRLFKSFRCYCSMRRQTPMVYSASWIFIWYLYFELIWNYFLNYFKVLNGLLPVKCCFIKQCFFFNYIIHIVVLIFVAINQTFRSLYTLAFFRCLSQRWEVNCILYLIYGFSLFLFDCPYLGMSHLVFF